jgi:hypothetical protein
VKKAVVLLLFLVTATGCGPGFRFRSPDILPRGDAELGVGVGAGGNVTTNSVGGMELQGFVRGSPAEHVEVGGRFYTHSFNHVGGSFEVRIAPIKRPVALSIDLGLMAGACCRLDVERNANLALGFGFDVGFSFGGRIGGDYGPAPYIAPHFQAFFAPPTLDPIVDRGDKLLFIPIGVDIPLGKSPVHLRPEFLLTFIIYDALPTEAILGGGFAFALQGPGFDKIREQNKAKKMKKKEEAAGDAEPAEGA